MHAEPTIREPIDHARQVPNQARASRELVSQVANETFQQLHTCAAREGASHWGTLRTGPIRFSGPTHLPPEVHELTTRMETAIKTITPIDQRHRGAITAFLWTARNQPLWDCNKRTGRIIVNGVLLQNA